MNKKRKNTTRWWTMALCAAVLWLLGGTQAAWAQTQRGVVANANVTKVNTTDITTNGQVVGVGEGTTVNVNVTSQANKAARVTVSSATVAATGASITGASEVNINNTITLTATVTPAYANTVVWTVSDDTKAKFVSGTDLVSTLTTTVNVTTGQATATLKGVGAGTVTVSVKATNDAATSLSSKSVTVPATVITAPTAKTGITAYSNATIINAGTALGGTMMYKVTNTNSKPSNTSSFSATVPTAQNQLLAAGTYYVWYYAKGNTGIADSEISATGIQVTVLGPALSLTSPAKGQVICGDGKNYNYSSRPSGVPVVAEIFYVNGSHGLALALTDENNGYGMNWSQANNSCEAHTPAFTGGTWKLASQAEWDNMITGAGGYTYLRDGFASVGGTNMTKHDYWSSTSENQPSKALAYDFIGETNIHWTFFSKDFSDQDYAPRGRACLSW